MGGARPGDKTMLDALHPLAAALDEALRTGRPVNEACGRALAAASAAAQQTAELLPRIGRARPHAEHSLGTPDPGAMSLVLVASSAAETLIPELRSEGLMGSGANA